MRDLNFPRADCHSHTLFSDGTLSPVELLELAKKQALTGLSITDHDTTEAYEVATPLAASLGIELVPGIEISTEYQNTSIHVLGYAFDLNNAELQQSCLELQKTRDDRNQQIIDKLAQCNIVLSLEEIREAFPHGTLGRPHIAQMMVRKRYISTAQKAFELFLGDGKRCYVKGALLEVEGAIELIHRAGGFAVIAHPHYIKPRKLIQRLSEMPFDGIEAYYGRMTLAQEQPWIKLAHQKNWFTTGGSDFHGHTKPHALLGSSWTPEEVFDVFRKRTLSHRHPE